MTRQQPYVFRGGWNSQTQYIEAVQFQINPLVTLFNDAWDQVDGT